MAPKVDTLSSPYHSFNCWFGNSQDCDIISQPHLRLHHSRVDSGSGSILIVSVGNSAAYRNLRWVSFHILDTYEETGNPYFAWRFNFDCMEHLWAFLENLSGFHRLYYISDEIDVRHRSAGIRPPLTGYHLWQRSQG